MTESPELSDPRAVAQRLPLPDDAVVLLDFDGCVSFLVDDPEQAAPATGAVDAIAALVDRTRVILVSGRPVSFLRSVIPTDVGVDYAGGHGAEFARGDDAIEPLVDVEIVQRHRDAAIRELEEVLADAPGWHVEPKPTGVAVHTRRAEDPTSHLDRVERLLERHRGGDGDGHTDMVVVPSHDVVELRPAGVDKGTAAQHLLGDDGNQPVAFGDDVTDEDMFVVAVDRGGQAVLVATEPRETHASHRVRDPDDVVAVLTAWAERVG